MISAPPVPTTTSPKPQKLLSNKEPAEVFWLPALANVVRQRTISPPPFPKNFTTAVVVGRESWRGSGINKDGTLGPRLSSLFSSFDPFLPKTGFLRLEPSHPPFSTFSINPNAPSRHSFLLVLGNKLSLTQSFFSPFEGEFDGEKVAFLVGISVSYSN